MGDYYSVTEYANMMGKDPGNIRRLLITGRLLGEKIGNQWVIKKGTEYPKDERVHSNDYHNYRQKIKFNSKNKELARALKIIVPMLSVIYGGTLKEVILYGSYARGDETEESDIDIALILDKGHTSEMHDMMIEAMTDKDLEYGKVFSMLTIEYDTFNTWKDTLPFYKNIIKEGIVLWKAA